MFQTELLGLGVWCLTALSTIFQLHHGGQFYWWSKSDYPQKTTDLSQVTHRCLEIKIPLKVDLQKKKHYKKPKNNRKTEPTSKKISFNVSIYIF
jgi:hypothetical protein